jgi:hypothetical protein
MSRFVLAGELLHFSAEPRIIADQINAAYMAGLDQRVLDAMMTRFETVYPEHFKEFVLGKPQN